MLSNSISGSEMADLLVKAIRAGDLAETERLIVQGANVNPDDGAITPLMHAVDDSKPNPDIVQLLLKHGANTEQVSYCPSRRHFISPLTLAVYDGKAEIARHILEHGAASNSHYSNYTLSPYLSRAVRFGDYKMVLTLLENIKAPLTKVKIEEISKHVSKEDLFKHAIKSTTRAQEICKNILDRPETGLSQFFMHQRGILPPSTSRGLLKEIHETAYPSSDAVASTGSVNNNALAFGAPLAPDAADSLFKKLAQDKDSTSTLAAA